jgi:hypothetical protein
LAHFKCNNFTINKRRITMAAPIGATPILEGKEATEWWEKVEKEQDQKLSLVPTPKLEDLRREIVASANKKTKK